MSPADCARSRDHKSRFECKASSRDVSVRDLWGSALVQWQVRWSSAVCLLRDPPLWRYGLFGMVPLIARRSVHTPAGHAHALRRKVSSSPARCSFYILRYDFVADGCLCRTVLMQRYWGPFQSCRGTYYCVMRREHAPVKVGRWCTLVKLKATQCHIDCSALFRVRDCGGSLRNGPASKEDERHGVLARSQANAGIFSAQWLLPCYPALSSCGTCRTPGLRSPCWLLVVKASRL